MIHAGECSKQRIISYRIFVDAIIKQVMVPSFVWVFQYADSIPIYFEIDGLQAWFWGRTGKPQST
jgi:hypothetical protein